MRLKNTLPPGRQYDWARNKSIEECLDALRTLAEQDLGTDPETWENWWHEERKRLEIDPEF